jgi:O-antigen ligase
MEAVTETRLAYPARPLLHLGAVFGLALMLMLNWPEAYRAFAYLNVLIVLAHVWPHRHDPDLRYAALTVLSFPFMLSLLHMIAMGRFEIIKEIRHLWLAGLVCLSVLILFRNSLRTLRPALPKATLIVLLLYCLAQIVALFVFDRRYGTSRNPHYLALYSALGIPVAIYLLTVMRGRVRLILAAMLLSLGAFVLYSWSRPVWIALILSALLMLLFLDNRKRLLAGLLVLIIPLGLFFTNLAGFGDRVSDLALNIRNEERVVIWQDAWRMQQASNVGQWLAGHGLDSYEEDFKRYSRFESTYSFHSPHNSFLEMVYTSGILGLALCVWLYWWIYSRLWRMVRRGNEGRRLSLTLMSITTINLLFIMVTIPFVSHYNMYTLAFVIGLILYWKTRSGTRSHET